MHVLLLLSPQHRLPIQSEGWCRASLNLSVSREGPGGGANRLPVARHNKVCLQSDLIQKSVHLHTQPFKLLITYNI